MTSESPSPAPESRLQRRTLLAAAAVLATQGTIFAASLLLFPSRVRAARSRLKELPAKIGEWTSVDVEPDERVVGSLQCDDILGRHYTNSLGDRVVLHMASWTDPGEWTPHPPERCFTNNGWKLLARRRPDFWKDARRQVETQTYNRDGQQVLVTYWYQIGGVAYHNRDGGRSARTQFAGQSSRPPLFKVMLQIPDLGEGTNLDGVKELATEIEQFIARQ